MKSKAAYISLFFLIALAFAFLVGFASESESYESVEGSWFDTKPSLARASVGDAPYGIGIAHADLGLVTVKFRSDRDLGLQVITSDDSVSYIVEGDGEVEVFPITLGDGDYSFILVSRNEDGNWENEAVVRRSVSIASDVDMFTHPGAICDFSSDSQCVLKAEEIARASVSDEDFVDNVKSWINASITYDKWKSLFPPKRYTPDPDETFASGKGICIDIASLAAAMLRSQSIPTRIVIGYIEDDKKHAWNEVYIDGEWQTFVTKSGEFEYVKSIIKYQ